MSAPKIQKLQQFLTDHPAIEVFEVILPDCSGNLRGKWVTRDKIHKVFDNKIKLPLSTLSLDCWGRDVESIVFESGDGDGICAPDINTLSSVPWLKRPTGQVLTSLHNPDQTPCAYDPRNILKQLIERLAGHGLTPVVASEMEFYLFKPEYDERGCPLLTQTDNIGGQLASGSTYSIDLMAQMADLMHTIREACEEQNLPIDTLIKEAAPSQYEINLIHCDDALLAADYAVMLERTIKGVAAKFGLRASFMAKPFGHLAGNGKHLHCSLLDQQGSNAFNNDTDQGNELLQQAIAGCLDGLEDSMLMFAPHLNSFRRFQAGSHAPMDATWGYENRTVAIRVPADDHAAMRIEHRVGGADANNYLVVASLLAGMLNGIENKMTPPPAITGNAYAQDGASNKRPPVWQAVTETFANSNFIKEYFGSEFQHVYYKLKLQEIDEYAKYISPIEYEIER